MNQQNREVFLIDLGKIPYKKAWDFQEKLLEEINNIKIANRNLQVEKQQKTPGYFILCEHPHVYTLGKSGSINHLLINDEMMKNENIEFFNTNRGGDITYHGPGQIVGYPIIDLDNYFTDIHKYLRSLEEVIILTLAEYGISADRFDKFTGVWLEPDNIRNARKICAMGVKCKRWITMHGFAFNVNTQLEYFDKIIPCGITDKAVTSLSKELGILNMDMNEVKEKIAKNFEIVFGATLIEKKSTPEFKF